ncbi:unnamed protein product [Pleuronectes platessa]|uniref:Uncharacterized protein n=1 Tax=Pleuronectes platessa TaxID=8262 RepID=A0A9N7Z9W6_PLEPL|nr:unnamed protein product [Pleuronectes platessa]
MSEEEEEEEEEEEKEDGQGQSGLCFLDDSSLVECWNNARPLFTEPFANLFRGRAPEGTTLSEAEESSSQETTCQCQIHTARGLREVEELERQSTSEISQL